MRAQFLQLRFIVRRRLVIERRIESEFGALVPAHRSDPSQPAVDFRFADGRDYVPPHLSKDQDIAIGPGKVSLLEAIDRTGSISAAGRELGMSYRRAWLLIDEINQSLKEPAVTTSAGGAGSSSQTL